MNDVYSLPQMNVTWRNYLWSQPRPTEPGEIESLEQLWGVALPDDYKNALSLYQGMAPRPNAFDVGRGENVIAALLITAQMSNSAPTRSWTPTLTYHYCVRGRALEGASNRGLIDLVVVALALRSPTYEVWSPS